MAPREGFSLDGRELATGRQVRRSKRGGRPLRARLWRRGRVVASSADPAGHSRATVPPSPDKKGRFRGENYLGDSLPYLAPPRLTSAAKVACRACRSTQRARRAWDADFRKITAAGARR